MCKKCAECNQGSQGRLLRARMSFPNLSCYSAEKYAFCEQPAFYKNLNIFCHKFFSSFIHSLSWHFPHSMPQLWFLHSQKSTRVLGEPFWEWVIRTGNKHKHCSCILKHLRLLSGDSSRVVVMLLFLLCKLAQEVLYDLNLITFSW